VTFEQEARQGLPSSTTGIAHRDVGRGETELVAGPRHRHHRAVPANSGISLTSADRRRLQ